MARSSMYKAARKAKNNARRAHLLMVYGGSPPTQWKYLPMHVKQAAKSIGEAAYQNTLDAWKAARKEVV